jgi:catechol 2,3-dioxygenase-like lactoylglutathione lyase family enzyme
MQIRNILVLIPGWLACCTLARAAAVPDYEHSPVDVRRTTLVVRDIEASLPFYRDALSLKLIYDEKIGGGRDKSGKIQPPSIRLVLLRANDDFIGAIGLMQRLSPLTPPPPPVFQKAQVGDAILVVNVADLDTRFERIRATPGVKVAEEPHRVDYPAPGGKGRIPVLFSAVWDADGNYVELNKLLGTPAGATAPPKNPTPAPAPGTAVRPAAPAPAATAH